MGSSPARRKARSSVQSAVAHSPPARPRQGGGRSRSSPPRTCRHSFCLAERRYMSDMRILIIEDDRDAAAYLSKAFREAGHIADQANDGVDRLRSCPRGRPTTSPVVDRMLPKMDGLTLVGALARAEQRDAGSDPLGARAGRRPRQGPARRRRRLSVKALCVLRASGPGRGAVARAAPRARRRRRCSGSPT